VTLPLCFPNSETVVDRIAGATTEVAALRDRFNSGKQKDLSQWLFTMTTTLSGQQYVDSSVDVYAVCDLFKSWLRVLPEPVFPEVSYHAIISATSERDDHDSY
jgi:GTPase-activating protein BEM2